MLQNYVNANACMKDLHCLFAPLEIDLDDFSFDSINAMIIGCAERSVDRLKSEVIKKI